MDLNLGVVMLRLRRVSHEVTVCQQLTQATHHQLTPLLSASQQPSGLSVQAFTWRLLLVCGFDPGYGPDVSHEHFVLMLGSYTAQLGQLLQWGPGCEPLCLSQIELVVIWRPTR